MVALYALAYPTFLALSPQISEIPHWKRDVAGYTKITFTTAKAVPSFDECINWQSISATNSDQTCADICTKTSNCKFFAVSSTASATYCGWWDVAFTANDATVKNWDGQGAITGVVSAYNKGASSGSTTSKTTSTTQKTTTTSAKASTSTAKTTSTTTELITTTAKTTTTKAKTTTSTVKTTTSKTTTSPAPSATSTNCGVQMWFENVNRSPTDIYFDVPSLQACANHCYDNHDWKWGDCKSYSWYPQESYCEIYVQDFAWNMQWATRDVHSPIYMYDAACDVNSTAAIIAKSPTKENTALTAAQRKTSCGVYGWPKTELQEQVRTNPNLAGNFTQADCLNYCATSWGWCLSVEWRSGGDAQGNCYAYAGPWETRIDTCDPAVDAGCVWQFYEATCV
ncbi:hypothetical protein TWF694_004337 [Orbilia ellipsospora]|uniref:Apple domain-containing protein n=1 Tax=Orbilia ellipsospora TaxID=2528407 RepID=A0AAV9WY39_9PEZI